MNRNLSFFKKVFQKGLLTTSLTLLAVGCSESGEIASSSVDTGLVPHGTPAVAELPDWFNQNRIQLHWEGPLLHLREDGTPDKRFKRWLEPVHGWIEAMGTSVTIGLAKKAGEGAWWPTEIGASLPEAAERDIFSEFFLESMQRRGIEYIAYYRHDVDVQAEKEHPEWRALDADGNPHPNYREKGASSLCYNTPYRDFVQGRLVELARKGVPAIYFDSFHMPEICTCAACREKFAADRGYPMPENLQPFTEEYLDVGRFIAETIDATFADWKGAVSEVNPEIVFIAGNTPFVQFDGIHHSGRMSESVDSLKTEFQKCFGGQQHWPGAPLQRMAAAHPEHALPDRSLQESVAWVIARDAAGGRPPHMWNWAPEANFGETFHTNTALVAHGAISSTHVDFFAKEQFYEELFDLNDRLAPLFATADPFGWAAVLVSNSVKERLYPAGGDADISYRQRFEGLYAPALAAFRVLQENHFPYEAAFDENLLAGQLSPETRVLIVPSADLLPDDLTEALAKLEADGLTVIRMDSNDPWYLKDKVSALESRLLDEIITNAGTPPVELDAPASVRAQFFTNERGLLVTAVQDWNYFWFYGNDKSNRRAAHPELDPVEGMELIVRDPSFQVARAEVVDFKEAPGVEIAESGKVLFLPEFSIYQFTQIYRKP